MNRLIEKNVIFIFLFVLCSVFLDNGVFAQNGGAVGIRLQPAIIEDSVEPGTLFNSILKVTNLSDSEKTYYLIVRDIDSISSTGTPIFSDESEKSPFSMSSWVSTERQTITVKSGETKEVPIFVRVPRDASPGGHFAGLFVSEEPPRVTGLGSGVGYQVATIVSLQVAGDINEEARIREFATGRFVYTKAEIDFKTTVENLGNVLVRARGPLEITDIMGKKVASLVVNDQGAVVLPDSTREFNTVWTGEGLKIGRYQAVLGLVYGNEGRKTITATVSFWVLPLNFILVVLAAIIGLLVLFFTVTHLYIRRKLSRMSGGVKADIYNDKSPSSRNMMFVLMFLAGVAMIIVLLMLFFA